jgi:hypothetical protein
MRWGLQIKKDDEWLWVRGGGRRYEYDSDTVAWNRLEMCYPDQIHRQRLGGEVTVRIKEIEDVRSCGMA